ncbi:TadE/TadG family type IV pilus assembly protein [Arthrobacter sp. TWP1-1]|uniref:TadE/TadG family type IV pilus assembly protein n=1 Tax=Arthrobacter sp. TWP1-1 TaxID=2804568 RepID=UPI003CEB40AE
MGDRRSEKGAAAVEFALVVPLLISLVFGIVLMGAAYNAQITLTQIARAAARSMVIDGDQGKARLDAMVNVVGLTDFGTAGAINFSSSNCPADGVMTVTATYPVPVPFSPAGSTILGSTPITLTGKASMLCGG